LQQFAKLGFLKLTVRLSSNWSKHLIGVVRTVCRLLSHFSQCPCLCICLFRWKVHKEIVMLPRRHEQLFK